MWEGTRGPGRLRTTGTRAAAGAVHPAGLGHGPTRNSPGQHDPVIPRFRRYPRRCRGKRDSTPPGAPPPNLGNDHSQLAFRTSIRVAIGRRIGSLAAVDDVPCTVARVEGVVPERKPTTLSRPPLSLIRSFPSPPVTMSSWPFPPFKTSLPPPPIRMLALRALRPRCRRKRCRSRARRSPGLRRLPWPLLARLQRACSG